MFRTWVKIPLIQYSDLMIIRSCGMLGRDSAEAAACLSLTACEFFFLTCESTTCSLLMASMTHEASTMSMQNKILWSKMNSWVLSLGPVKDWVLFPSFVSHVMTLLNTEWYSSLWLRKMLLTLVVCSCSNNESKSFETKYYAGKSFFIVWLVIVIMLNLVFV